MQYFSSALVGVVFCSAAVAAEPYAPPSPISLREFRLPTINDALFRAGEEAQFYQSTASGDWRSGQYGCVRSGGTQFHEGVDIRCEERDGRGEPLDAVLAVAAGTVVYLNDRPGKSNYGCYVVVQHNVDGVELFSLYAHLGAVANGLRVGKAVAGGQRLGTLGYTAAIPYGIPRARAHLHLEFCLMVNPNFEAWYRKHYPQEPNEHGPFNGMNLVGLNPAALFWAARRDPQLRLPQFIQRRPEAFRALVGPRLRWLERNRWMLAGAASAGSPAAYEVSFDAFGVPRAVTPHKEADWRDAHRAVLDRNWPVLIRVNEAELSRNGCRGLVKKVRRQWQFTEEGLRWLELMTF